MRGLSVSRYKHCVWQSEEFTPFAYNFTGKWCFFGEGDKTKTVHTFICQAQKVIKYWEQIIVWVQ